MCAKERCMEETDSKKEKWIELLKKCGFLPSTAQ
jgi:hypothetical protein